MIQETFGECPLLACLAVKLLSASASSQTSSHEGRKVIERQPARVTKFVYNSRTMYRSAAIVSVFLICIVQVKHLTPVNFVNIAKQVSEACGLP